MKTFIYKLLSNGLLIALLVCLLAGYYYRALLFPQWYGEVVAEPLMSESAGTRAPVEESAAQNTAPLAEAAAPAAIIQEGQSASVVEEGSSRQPEPLMSKPASANAPVEEPAAQNTAPLAEITATAPVIRGDQSVPVVDEVSRQEPVPVPEQGIVVVESAAVVNESVTETGGKNVDNAALAADEVASVEAPFAPVLDNGRDPSSQPRPVAEHALHFAPSAVTPPPPTAAVADQLPSEIEALMAQARDAYWVGDYDIAKNAYEQAIAISRDNPAPYGELGNIYFAQGLWDEAADAYLTAAELLLVEGRVAEAKHLVLVLRGLDAGSAKQLEAAMPQDGE